VDVHDNPRKKEKEKEKKKKKKQKTGKWAKKETEIDV
jgi:hypothetical protein